MTEKNNNIPSFSTALLHPRFWFTWLMMGLWWLSAQLPFRLQLLLGKGIGRVMYDVAPRRRMIAKRNLELCFPELNQEQQQNLLLKNFEATGIAIFETGMAWFWSRKKLQNKVSINNFDELQALVEQKRGVLLVVFHFTTLEMLGAFTNYLIPTIHMTYRPHNNAVYDFVQARQRARHNTTSTVLDRDNVRGMLKSLKTGHCISYLPDQDYGRKQSVFVPFFGVVAATVTASSRLAAMAQTPVILLMCVW